MSLQFLHGGAHDRLTDGRPLAFGNDADAVFATEPEERLAPLGAVGAFECRPQRFQLNDFGIAELFCDERSAIAVEYDRGRQRGESYDDDQQENKAPEQRARPQRHGLSPSVLVAPAAGVWPVTVGAVVSTTAVVNDQLTAAIVLPAASCAPLTVAV